MSGINDIILAEPPFLSIQGEGQRTGRPTLFIRTAICNLRCRNCDSKNTWHPKMPNYKAYPYSLEKLKKAVREVFPIREICITGGEPTLEGNGTFFHRFIWDLHQAGYEFTVETAATIYNSKFLRAPVDLWSISPKAPCQMTGYVDWVNYPVLNAMIAKIKPKNLELKLLISNDKDMESFKAMINKLEHEIFTKLNKERIPLIIQPDCEANWTQESYSPELEILIKTTAKEIPTTNEYMKTVNTVAKKVMKDPFYSQFNLIVSTQFHKLLGLV